MFIFCFGFLIFTSFQSGFSTFSFILFWFHIPFLVTCYATLHWSVGTSVGPSVTLFWFFFLRSLASLLLPKWSSDIKYGPRPPARDWGSRVSGLVSISLRSRWTYCFHIMVYLNTYADSTAVVIMPCCVVLSITYSSLPMFMCVSLSVFTCHLAGWSIYVRTRKFAFITPAFLYSQFYIVTDLWL